MDTFFQEKQLAIIINYLKPCTLVMFDQLVVPEKFHNHPLEAHWKLQWGGVSRPKLFKDSKRLNWNFQRGSD